MSSWSQAFVVPTASSSRAVSGAFTPTVNSRTPVWESGAVERRRLRAALRMVAAEKEAAAPATTTGPSPVGAPLRVGMFGGGTVGGGVYEICEQDKKAFFQGLGCDSEIIKVCVRDSKKPRDYKMDPKTEVVTDYAAILDDDSINCVVELMGGVTDAKDVVFEAIRRNKHVVTANKALVAAYLGEIQELLKEHPGVTFGYEAAVCGGIPIIATLQNDYLGDKILKVCGIMNGTTNFMLSKMESEGADYGEVLKEAQDLGYAEADPTADVEGFDVQAKIALLTKLAFGATVPSDLIQCKGISSLTSVDFEYAKMMKSTIKLLGTAMRSPDGEKLSVFVSPVLVPLSHPIASARGAGNIVSVDSKNMGTASFSGPGAGRYPTANSVVNDIVRLGTGKVGSPFPFDKEWELESDFTSAFYLRITCSDDLGIIQRVGELAAENGVSIHAILQNPIEDVDNVDFVVTTDPCKQSQVDELSSSIGQEKWAKGVPLILTLL
ncbi:Homoserine dehydrogenase [Ectocarpus siliculosus]|uniref:Homoserine dehydrogenase n=1 Tax=Ectocarpus siliculosus TaxID=2880 RepID=D7FNL8_ECTSI|nr:Homoserine dehydrogenase [Ectocarpus siliculosus]|eukprot:CBJ26029.1 Homoserine dehydrogenase [Ectocarpus siliculosus]